MDTKVKHKFRFTAQQRWHYRNSAHFSFHGCSFIDASGASSFHHLNRGSCSEQYENNKTEINSMLCVTEVCASWWKMVELTQTKATTADTVQQQVLFQHQSLLVSLQTLLHITVTALFFWYVYALYPKCITIKLQAFMYWNSACWVWKILSGQLGYSSL